MLGRCIRCNIAAPNSRGNRGNVDNAPSTPVYQCRHEGLAYIVHAGQVDGEHTLPEVIGMVQKLVAASIASVIDQDIYASQAFNCSLCHVLHLLSTSYIARDCQALTAHGLYLCHQHFEFGGCAGGHCHICPRRCQCQGDTTANAATCASHYCSLSCECEIALI